MNVYSVDMTKNEVPTRIEIDPFVSITQYVGRILGHVTWEGDALVGVTELDEFRRLIIRFPDGRWAFATYTTRKGAR